MAATVRYSGHHQKPPRRFFQWYVACAGMYCEGIRIFQSRSTFKKNILTPPIRNPVKVGTLMAVQMKPANTSTSVCNGPISEPTQDTGIITTSPNKGGIGRIRYSISKEDGGGTPVKPKSAQAALCSPPSSILDKGGSEPSYI
jgi:hypothetical protein